jgi:DNA-binding NtrC family response regulator
MAEQSKHPILVVDDEPEILQSLRGLLRLEFEVHMAHNGFEALEILQRQPIHVVMTDQRMPEMTGVQLLSQVQGESPEAMRIVFTGYADIKAVIDAINQGRIFRYITKPWDPDELRALLHQACAEYEQIVARKRLLTDLRSHVAQGLALVQGLREGTYGTWHAAGQTAAEQFAEAGRACLEQLDRMLAPVQSPALG